MAVTESLRQAFEVSHRNWLGPWAIAEADNGGRQHHEPEHAYRTCFQRDRDRIIHCSAFRRLDYKTQVFVPHERDHYRTRLTHTIEVAQAGRDLARALRLNEDLVEAVALAHDLGHPPFGHAGEAALAELMADHGYFEHNRQSLRVVEYLEHPYPDFRGLNLCRVVRECLAKHTTRYDTPASGDFDPNTSAPMEGQLVDLCDEIAYTSADVEDALQIGWITREGLGEQPLWQRAWHRAEDAAPHARAIHKEIRAAKNLIAVLADDLVAASSARLASLSPRSPQDIRQASKQSVCFSESIRRQLDALQDFLFQHVYSHERTRASDEEGRRCITGLFEHLVRQPTDLPSRYARRVEHDGLQRVVCDYLAGMTDRYCRSEHDRLCGAAGGGGAASAPPG